jgi:hypothetical protein
LFFSFGNSWTVSRLPVWGHGSEFIKHCLIKDFVLKLHSEISTISWHFSAHSSPFRTLDWRNIQLGDQTMGLGSYRKASQLPGIFSPFTNRRSDLALYCHGSDHDVQMGNTKLCSSQTLHLWKAFAIGNGTRSQHTQTTFCEAVTKKTKTPVTTHSSVKDYNNV